MTPEKLLKQCLANDEDGWTYAFNYVLQYLTYMKVAENDKEDITQDTIKYFLEGRLNNIRNPKVFKQLLRLKAKGIFLQRVSKSRKNPTESLIIHLDGENKTKENPGIPKVLSNIEDRLWVQTATKIINSAIVKTGKKCSKLLNLYYEYKYLGKKIKTLASDLKTDYANLRLDIHRCNKKLVQQPEFKKLLKEHQTMPSFEG